MSTSSPAATTVLGGDAEPLIPMACRVNSPSAPAPFLALTIAGRKFAALLDSGASATLFGDEVLAHLHRRAIRLRACDITFHLASGKARSGGSARLVVRWEKRVRRHRFVHLPGLAVPVILGRDFLARTGIVIDIANGGYREGFHAPLRAFAKQAEVSEARPAPNISRSGRDALRPSLSATAKPVARRAPCAPESTRGCQPPPAASRAHPDRRARSHATAPPGGPLLPGAAEAKRSNTRAEGAIMTNPIIATASSDTNHSLPPLSANLSEREQACILALLNRFSAMFTEKPGCTDLVQHRIDTGDALPWKCNPRPVSEAKRKAIDLAVDELLETGAIQRSDSPWGFPVVLVEKKDGTFRLCVDYRRLNELTRKDAYPMPSIDSIVASLGGSQYFTILDASRGYLQVQMFAGDVAKTAFTCHRGLFEFTRMPFGCSGAAATFQRLIDRVLGEAKWRYAMAYLDDIVVYSRTFEEHIRHLEDVLTRLQDAGITLNPKKAQIAETRVSLLGFTIDSGRVLPCEEKVRALLEYPSPTDIKALRRFLGMVNYYRQFIPNCAALQAPLTALLRKNARWSWSQEQEGAVRALINALVDTAELRLPDLNKEFVIQADASDHGLGAVLLQEHEGVLRPVAFVSRSLTPAERNYSVTERECLAIVFALRKFDLYVDGVAFVVETDHMALTWLKRLGEPSGRLARWALTLQRYNFTVRYRKGSTNVVADALSRAPVSVPLASEATQSCEHGEASGADRSNETSPEGTAATPRQNPGNSAYLVAPVYSSGIAFSREELREAQQNDTFCLPIIERLREEPRSEIERGGAATGRPVTAGIAVGAEHNAAGTAAGALDTYLLDAEGILLRYIPSEEASDPFKVVIPRSLRKATLSYFHDSRVAGHACGPKTYFKLCNSVTWPGMKRDALHFARSCRVCQSVKPRGGKAPGLMQSIKSQQPWQIAACDVMGPFPRSRRGHTYLLAVTDHFTKWGDLFPLRKLTARAIWDKLSEVFTRFGYPAELITDNASYFTAKVFVDACAALGIKHRKTTTYHPQANPTERLNRNVKHMLAAFAEQHRDWDAYLPELSFALRTTVNRSTGFTPAFLTFGRELPNPMDRVLRAGGGAAAASSAPSEYAAQLRSRMEQAISLARRNLDKARAGQKAQYDKAHREVRYQAGDLVLRRNHVLSDATKGISASLSAKWSGPYRVGAALTPLVYQLVNPKGQPVGGPVNVADLKPFVARSDDWDDGEATPSLRKQPKRGAADQRPNTHRYRLRKRA